MLTAVSTVPARYDQRQDGDFNVHAQLKNFLLIVAIPSKTNEQSNLLGELALQALELKQQLMSRAGSSLFGLPKDHTSDSESLSTVYKSNGTVYRGEEPYSLEIIQINGDRQDEEGLPRDTDGKSTETLDASNQRRLAPLLSKNGQDEKIKNIVNRTAKNAKDFKLTKNREVPAILGYFVDARRMHGLKIEDSDRVRDIEFEKPGTLLKKQLFRKENIEAKEEEKEEIAFSSKIDTNNVTFSEEKQQELKLLGNGIENCGPNRRRDASGICQESAASLL